MLNEHSQVVLLGVNGIRGRGGGVSSDRIAVARGEFDQEGKLAATNRKSQWKAKSRKFRLAQAARLGSRSVGLDSVAPLMTNARKAAHRMPRFERSRAMRR